MSVWKRGIWTGGVAVWLVAIAVASKFLLDYEFQPGPRAGTPSVWPDRSGVPRSAALPTLVLFAHPRCPCTRATISELAVLMTQCRSSVDAHVRFYRPANEGLDWHETDLWRSAGRIPGVQVASDPNGAETLLFGATTSGHVVLYDVNGRLLYSGGITSSRGHAGENVGRLAVRDLVLGREGSHTTLPAFGCALRSLGDHAAGCATVEPLANAFDGSTL